MELMPRATEDGDFVAELGDVLRESGYCLILDPCDLAVYVAQHRWRTGALVVRADVYFMKYR